MIKQELKITIKLFSGIAKESGIKAYDQQNGITLRVKKGIRIKKLIKGLRLQNYKSLAYFINGEPVEIYKKLQENCELVCIKPTAGG